MSLQTFLAAYLEAVDFTKADIGDDDAYDAAEGFSATFLTKAERDCAAFYRVNRMLFACRDQQAGHDFWLTRQGHGAGFWNRSEDVYPEAAREHLTGAAHAAGEVYAYVSDNNEIDC